MTMPTSDETKKKKILIVDDNESDVVTLTARLEQKGYEVVSAYTGEKGLQTARTELPDVILLDVVLPGDDGLAVLRKLKRPIDAETGEPSKTRRIPVIMLTGVAEGMGDTFQAEEAFAFLTKPLDSKSLVASIEKALETR
jgi:CheY-like chemotaxis protein